MIFNDSRAFQVSDHSTRKILCNFSRKEWKGRSKKQGIQFMMAGLNFAWKMKYLFKFIPFLLFGFRFILSILFRSFLFRFILSYLDLLPLSYLDVDLLSLNSLAGKHWSRRDLGKLKDSVETTKLVQ